MRYYIISSDLFGDRPYLRIAYDMKDGKLVMSGYSHMTDWKDATIFQEEGEARLIMSTNNPKNENLRLLRFDINIENL